MLLLLHIPGSHRLDVVECHDRTCDYWRRRRRLQGCLMRVAALTTLVAGARAMSLKAGAQVPKFAVTAHTGAAVSSDSLAGSAYCLWFYPKADTGG